MAQKAVQLRPTSFDGNFSEIDNYLVELIGHPVPSTKSLPPIYFFVTSEENIEKIKQKFGDKVSLTIHDVDE
ncbi:hypothetical protein B0T10DRAFT_567340 [Thelonectria olida]|uniref:Uncharacterized protein n=1 Tax=Thelonectria olida TaxID=1576542 RepID=A0A9P8VT25_9HYPO|nr:hypothetical protein B0T10DRAFT_567340 [Thelonectria olida]